MSIVTHQARPGDEELLHDLAARTFGLACPPGTAQADIDAFVARHLSTEAFAGYLTDSDRIVLMAAVDGDPVGYSMLVTGPIGAPDVAALIDAAAGATGAIELSKFYLAAERHGSGVATALMDATLRAAAATGAGLCWLGVNQRNVRAAKFYARHGFEIAGVKRFLVGEQWHDDHVRVRPLTR